MSYCPKCGAKVREEMSFCPKCGAALKVEQPPTEAAPPAPPSRPEKYEKREKREKEEKKTEKSEKREKYEKREYAYIGPLIGGLILIVLGLTFYLAVTAVVSPGALWAFFFVIIGIIIIFGAVYAAMVAARRHPET